MAYSSAGSIVILLPDLPSTDTSDGYSQTVQLINEHVTRADNIINGKIAQRYSVPISPTPPLLRTLAAEYTRTWAARSYRFLSMA